MLDSPLTMPSRSTVESTDVVVPVTMHWLWAPLGLLLVIPVPALLGSISLIPDQFPVLFRQPYFLTEDLKLQALVYLAVLGVIFALIVPMRSRAAGSIVLDRRARGWLSRSVTVLSAITLAAYAVWIGAALVRGLRLQTILALLQGDPGTMYVLRNEYFETLGGITTWMQLGALVVPLAILRAKAGGPAARRIVIPIMLLAAARALLNSERLALIEVVLSAVLATLILRQSAPRVLRRLLPSIAFFVACWGVLYLSFSLFEFFRSWTNVQNTYPGSFWSYSGALLLGYYATALNLSAFDSLMLNGAHLPVALFDGNLYTSLFGVSPIAGAQKAYGLETFTNRSGLFTPAVALGFFGGLIIILVMAFLIGSWARATTAGSVVAFAAYCASAVGVLEIVRIFYYGSSRFLPVMIAIVFLAVSWGLSRHAARRLTTPRRRSGLF